MVAATGAGSSGVRRLWPSLGLDRQGRRGYNHHACEQEFTTDSRGVRLASRLATFAGRRRRSIMRRSGYGPRPT